MEIYKQINLLLNKLRIILPKELKDGHYGRIIIEYNCSSIRNVFDVKHTEKGYEIKDLME
jgi:hypothetical protein